MKNKYYAILEDGECLLHSGRNAKTPQEAAEEFLELKLTGLTNSEAREYKSLYKRSTPEEFINTFNSELLIQDEPFPEGD